MSIPPINSLGSYLQPILGQTKSGGNSLTGIDPSSVQPQADNTQISPFAQMLNQLQQLQQSDPTKYQQVTQQIATNLQSAAQTAQSEGNSTKANQLNQLATDFTNASKTGQPVNLQDTAHAIGGHHHRHHHAHAAGQNNPQDVLSSIQNALSSSGTNSAPQS